MFLYEGDCLKNVTVIRGVRYVTVSHYSGDKEVCDKLGDMLTDAFRSCNLHEVILMMIAPPGGLQTDFGFGMPHPRKRRKFPLWC